MNVLMYITKCVMPCLLLIFALIFLLSKRNLIDSFMSGAKQGAECCFNLLPTLLLVMCAVSCLYASGAVDVICNVVKPLFITIGVPEQMLPTIVLRPFSGSGVTAIADRMFKDLGPDSDVSKIACLLMGSTDNIIYTLSVYFSSANIKRTRYAMPASFVVFIFSIFICVFVGKKML